MYLSHDLYSAYVRDFMGGYKARAFKSAMSAWPTKTVYTEYTEVAGSTAWNSEPTYEPVLSSAIEVLADEIHAFNHHQMYLGHYDEYHKIYKALGITDTRMHGEGSEVCIEANPATLDPVADYYARLACLTLFYVNNPDRIKRDNTDGLAEMYLTLNPELADDISYEQVAEYINENTELMDDAKLLLMSQARSRRARLLAWLDVPDYLNNPPTYVDQNLYNTAILNGSTPEEALVIATVPGYADDPGFPLTNADIRESMRLNQLDEWETIDIVYRDRASAYYVSKIVGTGSVYVPVAIDSAEIHTLITSGIFSSFNTDYSNAESVVTLSDEYKKARSASFDSGTLIISAMSNDAVAWMPLAQGGMDPGDIYAQNGAKYTPPTNTYDENGEYLPGYSSPYKLFDTEIRIVSSTIALDPSTDNRLYYVSGNNSLKTYLDRYVREVNITFKYKRVCNAYNSQDLAATVAPVPINHWVTAVNNGRVAAVDNISDILSSRIPIPGLLTSYINQTKSKILPSLGAVDTYVVSAPTPITISNEEYNETKLTNKSYFLKAGVDALPYEEYAFIVGRSISYRTEALKKHGVSRYIGLILVVVVSIACWGTCTAAAWALYAGLVLVATAYVAAETGHYGTAMGAMKAMVIVQVVGAFTGIAGFISAIASQMGLGKELAALKILYVIYTRDFSTIMSDVETQELVFNEVMEEVTVAIPTDEIIASVMSDVVISAKEFVAELVSEIMSGNIGAIASTMNNILSVYNLVDFLTNGKSSVPAATVVSEGNEASSRPDAFEKVYEMQGTNPHNNIFELPEKIDFSYAQATHAGMCQAPVQSLYT